MTTLLEKAFRAAAELSEPEQDALAARMLAELAEEDEFDLAIGRTAHKLVRMTEQALAEHRAGLTKPIPAEGP